ncbi:MAG: tetratricopeptide repeat protein [Deltaproteobacteria bacterium]|nr:tetratricopeptide repeat protein [Deltaproteobacteria bacterium]
MAHSNISWNLSVVTPHLPSEGPMSEIPQGEDPLADTGRLARALDVSARENGEGHPDSIRLGELMGLSLNARGNRDGARDRLVKALAASERTNGPESPETLRIASNLGCVWAAERQFKRALPLFARAAGGTDGRPDQGGPEALAALNNAACAMAATGDVRGAAGILERVAREREGILGPEHPDTLDSRANLENALALGGGAPPEDADGPDGGDLEYEEDLAELEALSKKLRSCITARMDTTANDVRNAREALQSYLIGSGRLEGPSDMVRKLEKNMRLYGPDSPKTLRAAELLAVALRQNDLAVMAAALLAFALVGRLKATRTTGSDQKTDDPRAFITWKNMAIALTAMGEYDEAERHLEETIRGFLVSFGDLYPETVASRKALADTLDAAGKPEQAARVRANIKAT